MICKTKTKMRLPLVNLEEAKNQNVNLLPVKPMENLEEDQEKKKACCRCKMIKPISEFHRNNVRHVGYRYACKLCTNLAYSNYKKSKNKDPFKEAARRKTREAIRKGILKKQPCSVCGSNNKIEVHHEDYSKPLTITWLCKKHHVEKHFPNVLAKTRSERKYQGNDFKLKILERHYNGEKLYHLSKELGLSSGAIYYWKKKLTANLRKESDV